MSQLNNLDNEKQEWSDEYALEVDRYYGWEIDVSDTWYDGLWTKKLGELDCYYHYSDFRYF